MDDVCWAVSTAGRLSAACCVWRSGPFTLLQWRNCCFSCGHCDLWGMSWHVCSDPYGTPTLQPSNPPQHCLTIWLLRHAQYVSNTFAVNWKFTVRLQTNHFFDTNKLNNALDILLNYKALKVWIKHVFPKLWTYQSDSNMILEDPFVPYVICTHFSCSSSCRKKRVQIIGINTTLLEQTYLLRWQCLASNHEKHLLHYFSL